MAVGRAWYRVAQFLAAVRARFATIDIAYARSRLQQTKDSAALLSLFLTMSRVEQHHGIRVCQALERQGYADSHLLVAALLHDVGKTVMPLRLWERVFVVLGESFSPARAEAWGRNPTDVGRFGRGFVVRQHHMAWGAELVARAGANAHTAALIRRHHDPTGADADPLLKALQAADESVT